ncbi:hypothetical protein FA95DRAFT_197640 [Auriscalpium vulgare]|uniref:Uncharacterized protein n=1 Tax=Auriscalpium vulgare TaxID=40419 RepID=A0ACB8S637_9AGAM|nr:hypothetical protein FA95DRAFT_197640 [Auriscalpium vulgare]
MSSVARTESSSPVVSSSSTLWATASKEWVIPAKPKPGRKPKKDAVTTPVEDDEASESKGRRIQNRAAQRAFRERKQSQLAELQARIQMYEQGEIERNVALQAVAKRLKDENDVLRKENSLLEEKVAQYERERQAQKDSDNKHWRDESFTSDAYVQLPVRKKVRLAIDTNSPSQPSPLSRAFAQSPPSLVSSPGSFEPSEKSFSPVPMQSHYQGADYAQHPSPLDNMFDFQVGAKSSVFGGTPPMEAFDCGLCTADTSCVCREMALHQASRGMIMQTDSPFKMETVEPAIVELVMRSPVRPSTTADRSSILDNLPAYQPPVPLRRRAANPLAKSLFPVSAPSATPADCSGDPSNCMACADDVFGKAFCAAIGESVAASCDNCPSQHGSDRTGAHTAAESGGNCRGLCNGSVPPSTQSLPGPSNTLATLANESVAPEVIPTNEAWQRIKSHPNVSFADLSLLADVVARRSKCTGPTVVISPALGSITPERSMSPDNLRTPQVPELPVNRDGHPVLLSDPHAHYRMKQEGRIVGSSSPPRLVPHEELQCSRNRVIREVHADGVLEALRILDAKFAAEP